MPIPRVAICVDEQGNWSVVAVGDVNIYCIDEGVSHDRVYWMDKSLYTVSPKKFLELLGKKP